MSAGSPKRLHCLRASRRCAVSAQRRERLKVDGGFTLVELAVVLAIIGLLLAILLPAVQRAREASRRAQCSNHLKQISIAISSYVEVHGMYPCPRLMSGPGWSGEALSQHSFILPYLDQAPLYQSINFAFHYDDAPINPVLMNSTARLTRVAVLLCPSEVQREARSSYCYNLGHFHRPPGNEEVDGPFRRFRPTKPSDITDGLHRTAFLSERIGGSFIKGSQDRRVDVAIHPHIGGSFTPPFPPGLVRQYCRDSPVLEWFHTAGRYWYYSGMFFSNYNHEAPPNDPEPSCEVDGDPYAGRAGLYGPRSYHDGGVTVAFGDGHTEFISDHVDAALWSALGTRAGSDY